MTNAERREVRVLDAFFEMLDGQLGHERGADGEPSATDFLVMELPEVVDVLATRFDELPEVLPGLPSGRMYVGSGLLVRAFVVYGVEVDNGAVELIGIEIDRQQ